MKRSIDIYKGCDPDAMSKMSEAAIFFAFQDMKSDILSLHNALLGLYKRADIEMPNANETELARIVLAFKS